MSPGSKELSPRPSPGPSDCRGPVYARRIATTGGVNSSRDSRQRGRHLSGPGGLLSRRPPTRAGPVGRVPERLRKGRSTLPAGRSNGPVLHYREVGFTRRSPVTAEQSRAAAGPTPSSPRQTSPLVGDNILSTQKYADQDENRLKC